LRHVQEVMDPSSSENTSTFQGLRGSISASAGADPSLLHLKAANGDPEQAARVANTWAEQYVEYVNELYGRRSEDVVFFSEQFEAARSALEAAEQALVEYEARNQEAIFQARLDAKRLALEDYLNAQHELTLIIGDAQALRGQLVGQPASAPASLSNDLAALLLEIQGLSRDDELPLQLQVTGGGSLSNKTVGEQASLLNDLVAALVDRSAEIEMQAETLSAEILPLQEALQGAITEKERLTRAQEVAHGTFTTLANKVEEARIAAQDETGEVRLASRASVPTSPVGPRKLMNTAMAGILGLFVGVFAAFFVEYWQSPREEAGD
jgi:succinoglycan biosynthesis transport protein ExoP